jgi:hypothetical protein
MSYAHSPAASSSILLKNSARIEAVSLVFVNLEENKDCKWHISLVKFLPPYYSDTKSRDS